MYIVVTSRLELVSHVIRTCQSAVWRYNASVLGLAVCRSGDSRLIHSSMFEVTVVVEEYYFPSIQVAFGGAIACSYTTAGMLMAH